MNRRKIKTKNKIQAQLEIVSYKLQLKTDKLEKVRKRVGKLQKENADLKSQQVQKRKDLEVLTLQNNSYLQQVKDYHDEIESLRKQITGQVQAKQTLKLAHNKQKALPNRQSAKNVERHWRKPQGNHFNKKWHREAIDLRHSYSFRLGKILIDAFARPGKNTFIAPYYLVKLAWDMLSGRGRRKAQQALRQNF